MPIEIKKNVWNENNASERENIEKGRRSIKMGLCIAASAAAAVFVGDSILQMFNEPVTFIII